VVSSTPGTEEAKASRLEGSTIQRSAPGPSSCWVPPARTDTVPLAAPVPPASHTAAAPESNATPA